MLVNVSIHMLPHAQDLPLPGYATPGSAGVDLSAALQDSSLTINPNQRVLIPTGMCLALPQGWEAQIRPRSGLALKHGVTVLNTPGTIDSDYRGEVQVILINLGTEPFVVDRGMRVAQMVIAPVHQVGWQVIRSHDAFLAHQPTKRQARGFGSTGVRSIQEAV